MFFSILEETKSPTSCIIFLSPRNIIMEDKKKYLTNGNHGPGVGTTKMKTTLISFSTIYLYTNFKNNLKQDNYLI